MWNTRQKATGKKVIMNVERERNVIPSVDIYRFRLCVFYPPVGWLVGWLTGLCKNCWIHLDLFGVSLMEFDAVKQVLYFLLYVVFFHNEDSDSTCIVLLV